MPTEPQGAALLAELRAVCRCAHLLLTEQVLPKVGRYEADVAALCLGMLAVRHAEGVASCGELGPPGFPPMAACARSALETGLTAAWLMNASGEWEREGRWLGYHKAHARYLRSIAADIESYFPTVAARWRSQADAKEKWRTAIEERLPAAQVRPRPSFAEIVAELDIAPMYLAYRLASQLIHGEPPAAEYVSLASYERADMVAKDTLFEAKSRTVQFGDFVTKEDWAGVCKMGSFGVARGCTDLAKVCHAPPAAVTELHTAHGNLLAASERYAPSLTQ